MVGLYRSNRGRSDAGIIMKKLTKQTQARKVKPMVTKKAKQVVKYPKCPECKKDMYPKGMEYEAPKRYIVHKCDKCGLRLSKPFGNIQEKIIKT